MLVYIQNIATKAEDGIVRWLEKYAFGIMRGAIGVVYVWFGVLKFFPHLSPAEMLAADTIGVLTFGFVAGKAAVVSLAFWECIIGVALIFKIRLRLVLPLLLLHMIGTLTPFFIFPELTFGKNYAFTLLGQYILKNIVIISAAMVIYVAGKRK